MTTLRAGYNFLGKLGDDLRDLIGLDTLVYELVQNADDAPGSSELAFDIREQALQVWNDGVFSDCGDQESLECPLIPDALGVRVQCDFHSLRSIASQAKRSKHGTTGAFGIGFTSVFQVCDHPELLSRNRHWILHYERPEDDRIEVCSGCALDHSVPGTTFVLPWARERDSPIRRGLKMDPVSADVADRFADAAAISTPASIVFLRKVRRIRVLINGEALSVVERTDEGSTRRVTYGRRSDVYSVATGSFEESVESLRSRSAVFTDDVRDASVELAVPIIEPKGRLPLHVVLPTREDTELSLRISAPFFPFQNRKSVRFETDAESEWNRAAVRAAAEVLRLHIKTLVQTLKPPRLWSLIESTYRIARQAESTEVDGCFREFWKQLVEVIDTVPTVPTTGGNVVTPRESTLVPRALEFADPLLQALGFHVVDPNVRASIERLAGVLEVPTLSAEAVTQAMISAGLDVALPMRDLPPMLGSPKDRSLLLQLVDRLIEPHVRRAGRERVTLLDGAAFIPCHGRQLAPPELVALESTDIVKRFRRVSALLFADELSLRDTPSLRAVLAPLLAPDVVAALDDLTADEVAEFVQSTDMTGVMLWFSRHRDELRSEDLDRLAELPIFPAAEGFLPLTEMQLPGDFDRDPLGVARLLDMTGLDEARDFLTNDLSATTLDLRVYATDVLPKAFRNQHEFSDADLEALLNTINDARPIIATDTSTRDALAALPIILCRDGVRRSATSTYFESDMVATVLGDAQVMAVHGADLARYQDTLSLLGVRTDPQPEDVVECVSRIVANPKTPEARTKIRTVLEFLAPQFVFRSDNDREQAEQQIEGEYGDLRVLEWLPVADEQTWAAPDDLYRTEFRSAFATAARFIDLPERVQERASNFLELLGVRYRPAPADVVSHIQTCSQSAQAVSVTAYRFLNEADDDASNVRLRSFDSICIADTDAAPKFVAPDIVVAGRHNLGRYLVELPDELKSLHALVSGLDIPHAPDDVRAAHVLAALAEEYGDVDAPIHAQREAQAILRECWRILERERERASHAEEPDEETLDEYDEWLGRTLGSLPCWPNALGRLKPPRQLLIDDMPHVAKLLPPEEVVRLISSPREAPSALEAAGIRSLSTVVTTQLQEAANSRPDHLLTSILGERRDSIARVITPNLATGDSVDNALVRLDSISIRESDTLVVEYILHLDEDDSSLGTDAVGALFDTDAAILYLLGTGVLPSLEVAVQLSTLLCPAARHDAVAPALERVIAAETAQGAKRYLDLCGLAYLDDEVAERVASEAAQIASGAEQTADEDDVDELPEAVESDDTLGSSHTEREENDATSAGDAASASDDDDSALGTVGDVHEEDNLEDDVEGEQAVLPVPGQTLSDPEKLTKRPQPGGRSPISAPFRRSPTRTDGVRPPSPGPPRPRIPTAGVDRIPWRTWVSGRRGSRDAERDLHPERLAARRDVELAGIACVVEYERDHGREATVMPPNHPGFDIESGKGPGKPVLREIEVKSLGGSWEAEWARGGNPPQMTREQFRRSLDNGRHWLYVVENALDDDRWAIYPIQQVGAKATNFLFDHGWKDAADRPYGPGITSDYDVPKHDRPSVDGRTWPLEEADLENDIPFVPWNDLAGYFATPEADRKPPRWYAPPAAIEGGAFATQQTDHSMGRAAPFGSVVTIQSIDTSFRDGDVVLADVGDDGDSGTYVLRRAFYETEADGSVGGVLLQPELPNEPEFLFSLGEVERRIRGRVIFVDNPE